MHDRRSLRQWGRASQKIAHPGIDRCLRNVLANKLAPVGSFFTIWFLFLIDRSCCGYVDCYPTNLLRSGRLVMTVDWWFNSQNWLFSSLATVFDPELLNTDCPPSEFAIEACAAVSMQNTYFWDLQYVFVPKDSRNIRERSAKDPRKIRERSVKDPPKFRESSARKIWLNLSLGSMPNLCRIYCRTFVGSIAESLTDLLSNLMPNLSRIFWESFMDGWIFRGSFVNLSWTFRGSFVNLSNRIEKIPRKIQQ